MTFATKYIQNQTKYILPGMISIAHFIEDKIQCNCYKHIQSITNLEGNKLLEIGQ